MNAQTITRWMEESASAIGESRDYLTQLDAAIGDADHGSNMDRGFTAVVSSLDGLGDQPPGKVLIAAGRTLISNVGGASGPLWGSALRGAGKQLGDGAEFGPAELADALDAALAAVVELGAAEEGDKTMVDALAPAVRADRAGPGGGGGGGGGPGTGGGAGRGRGGGAGPPEGRQG